MAKKKAVEEQSNGGTGEKINKSELVRAYMRENPEHGPKMAAEALTTQTGQAFSAAFVSQIKMKMNKDAGKTSGRGRRKRETPQPTSNGSLDITSLEAIKELIRRHGAENVKRLVDVMS